jgi:hypothetical protein
MSTPCKDALAVDVEDIAFGSGRAQTALGQDNIEFSCPAALAPHYIESPDGILRATLHLRGQLQRFVRTPRFSAVLPVIRQTFHPMNLATETLKILASLRAVFLLIGRIPFSIFDMNCFGASPSLAPSCS